MIFFSNNVSLNYFKYLFLDLTDPYRPESTINGVCTWPRKKPFPDPAFGLPGTMRGPKLEINVLGTFLHAKT